ncbi:MAG TPA: response regulator [Rhizomicrobium sp.]|nr:response regulator [Rhizomicrobium sp.]
MDNNNSTAKVLVVEDMALLRMSTMEMVEQAGFAALGAGDGAQALALLRQDDRIAILVTDLGLPGMSGRQLVEEALRLKPGLKVIVASGYREEGFGTGVAILRKPFGLQQLRKALESCASSP